MPSGACGTEVKMSADQDKLNSVADKIEAITVPMVSDSARGYALEVERALDEAAKEIRQWAAKCA